MAMATVGICGIASTMSIVVRSVLMTVGRLLPKKPMAFSMTLWIAFLKSAKARQATNSTLVQMLQSTARVPALARLKLALVRRPTVIRPVVKRCSV